MSTENQTVRLSTMRKLIGRAMMKSLAQTAQFTLTREIDVDTLMDLIAEKKGAGEKCKLMYLMVKICGKLLDEHPLLNSKIIDGQLTYFGEKNIGVAVAVKDGLMVPVLRDVNAKSLNQIGDEYEEKISLTRAKRIPPKDLEHGTFTISNLGMAGIDGFTPIINYPEVAILGIGRTNERLYMKDNGDIGKKKTIAFSLTCDHCVVDGYTGALFLQSLNEVLNDTEKIMKMLE